jgi:hypothetical protein
MASDESPPANIAALAALQRRALFELAASWTRLCVDPMEGDIKQQDVAALTADHLRQGRALVGHHPRRALINERSREERAKLPVAATTQRTDQYIEEW